MKAAFLYGADDLRCEEIPVPEPGPGEILIRIRVCGLCGTDIAKVRSGDIPLPAVLGHEIAGEVAALGEGVQGFDIGERIAPSHHLPCFKCRRCVRGNHSQCAAFMENNIRPGGFAEYAVLNRRAVEGSVFRLPERVSYDEACFIETAGCCLRAFQKADVRPGDNVMVVGVGPVGLIHIQLAFIFGAGRVIAADIEDSRLAAAAEFGDVSIVNSARGSVKKSVDEITSSNGADVVIITAGSESAVSSGLEAASGGGKIVLFGGFPPGALLRLDPGEIYRRELKIFGSYSSSPLEQFSALEMISSGRLKVSGLVTGRFGICELKEAVESAANPEKGLKVVIDCARSG